nr:MAG TPA: ABC-type bacteriocin transporter [Caudoviricetes sp.]
MFEKMFAKYARAVSDEREREWLYKKYRAKTVVSIVFYVLCAAVIAGALALEPYFEQDWALAVMTVLIFAWIGFAVAALCLWISFKRMYNTILNRPSYAGEMPEVASYRQKVSADKKSAFRKLWWAWLLFGLCAVVFIVCIVLETIQNPDSEEFGVWGTAAFWVLLAGALMLFFAYFINALLKQQKGKAIEQQTAPEAAAIDRAQGRKSTYDIRSDRNAQTDKMYTYLFPNETLRERANAERIRRTKIITPAIIIFGIMSIAALALFLYFGLMGYSLPVMFTLLLGGTMLLSVCTVGKLKAIESEQKAELESNPEYAKNLEWYRLYDGFFKFKGKLLYLFLVAGIAAGWVLAILFPASGWSLLSVVPIMAGALINNRLVKDLRQKAIPIEKEIDAEKVRQGEADENADTRDDGAPRM